jgi:hypothetical protein
VQAVALITERQRRLLHSVAIFHRETLKTFHYEATSDRKVNGHSLVHGFTVEVIPRRVSKQQTNGSQFPMLAHPESESCSTAHTSLLIKLQSGDAPMGLHDM